MRPGEFWEAMDAHNREKEADRMHAGELARGVALRLVNIQLAKGSRVDDPAKFWPMPWDEVVIDEELERLDSLSPEERAAEARDYIKTIGW